MVLECISANATANKISAKKFMPVLLQRMFITIFFRERLSYFSKTKLNHILHLLQQHCFMVERILYQTRVTQHSSPKDP